MKRRNNVNSPNGATAPQPLGPRVLQTKETIMAMASNSRTAPFGAIATLNFVNMFEGVVKSVSEWNAHRKTQSILASLSDRELSDIGLSRADLDTMPSKL